MRTIKHFILTNDDVKALEKTAQILHEIFRDHPLSAGDIQNIANIAEGIKPIHTECGNLSDARWEMLEDSVTKATE